MTLGIQETQFTIDGTPTFLYGISYYGALGASETFIRQDFADMKRLSFNWFRVWATWAAFGSDVSAVDAESGRAREPFLSKLGQLVAEADRQGLIVDVTLSRGNGITGPPRLQSHEAHRCAVETVVTALKGQGNWYLDLSNERSIRDKRFTSFAELAALRETARRLDPERLVTASSSPDIPREELPDYLKTVGVDFLSPHRARKAGSAEQTEDVSRAYLGGMREVGRVVPLHYQEPMRRGFGKWGPSAGDFVTDLRGAVAGGAAGWCFHNGDQRDDPEGRPRRSFGLTEKRLFDQLDDEERKALAELRAALGSVERKEA